MIKSTQSPTIQGPLADTATLHTIRTLLREAKMQKRVALSKRYPILRKTIISLRRTHRKAQHIVNQKVRISHSKIFLPVVIARHKSLLKRKLGDSDPVLQENKITNLALAVKKINGIIIKPGNIFSFWEVIGKPTRRRGFVDGMLLADGIVVAGIGGGLCQLSNFLHWIFLHAPTKIIERYHHSKDVFPDSGRTLPFGSGATVLYNFIDLKIKNTSTHPLQIKLWLTDKHLCGAILCDTPSTQKYHITEKNHFFIHAHDTYYRYNELYRQELIRGNIISEQKIITNFAPVLYPVSSTYLNKHGYQCLSF